MRTIDLCEGVLQKKQEELSFKEKLNIVRILDELKVSAILLPEIKNKQADSLFIKSAAPLMKESIAVVSTGIKEDEISVAYEAVKNAAKKRLQIVLPLSAPRLEYVYHVKLRDLPNIVKKAVTQASSLCEDVEFVIEDATRSDKELMHSMIVLAIECGAKMITVCDSAGKCLPQAFGAFIDELYAAVPKLAEVKLGISCSNQQEIGNAVAFEGICHGASQVSVATFVDGEIGLSGISKVIAEWGASADAAVNLRTTQLGSGLLKIQKIFNMKKSGSGLAKIEHTEQGEVYFTASDQPEDVEKGVTMLAYTLSREDLSKVYQAFRRVVAKRGKISLQELDALVAAEAMQVPETYVLESYMVTTGNVTDVLAHVKMIYRDQILNGVSLGDGPIDAAFLAIEKVTGTHYELDDFELRSITEGRGAMGETIVKLRANGKVYSGRGISTDIIGSGIHAYVSALNKIVYEEENGQNA